MSRGYGQMPSKRSVAIEQGHQIAAPGLRCVPTCSYPVPFRSLSRFIIGAG
jgi:hypothetical protein